MTTILTFKYVSLGVGSKTGYRDTLFVIHLKDKFYPDNFIQALWNLHIFPKKSVCFNSLIGTEEGRREDKMRLLRLRNSETQTH